MTIGPGFQERAADVIAAIAGASFTPPGAPHAVPGATLVADLAMLRAYGLVADGVTDDAPAVQAMLNATALASVFVQFPPGQIYFGSGITTSGARNVTIAGCGSQVTTLVFGAAVAIGWNHGQGTAGVGTFHARGLTLAPRGNATGIALRVSLLYQTDPTGPGFALNDVLIGTVNPAITWLTGAAVYGAWNSQINNSYIFGPAGSAVPAADGIYFSGAESVPEARSVTTVLTCDNLFIQGCGTGLQVAGNVQGVNLVNCNISGTRYGVQWNSPTADGSGTLQVTNSQFACSFRAVLMSGSSNPMISNSLFIQFDNAAAVASSWCCIEGVDCPNPFIDGNFILNPGGTIVSANAAIWLHSTLPGGSNPGRVTGNTIETQCKAAVEYGGTVNGVPCTDNNFCNVGPGSPANVHLQTPAAAWTALTSYPGGSAVTSSGNTYTTVAGGMSGMAAPSGVTTFTDSGVTWVYCCPSLASNPNPSVNYQYGVGNITTDATNSLVIGQPARITRVRGSATFDNGIDVGGPTMVGYLDLHSPTVTPANDYDVRIVATGGAAGSLGAGVLSISASLVSFGNAALVDVGLPAGDPHVSGSIYKGAGGALYVSAG